MVALSRVCSCDKACCDNDVNAVCSPRFWQGAAVGRVYPFTGAVLAIATSVALAAEPLEVKVGYLRLPESKPAISLLDVPPDNDGIAGARLAIEDNNTTGKFLDQRFLLEEVRLKEGGDPAVAVASLAAHGVSVVIADLPPDTLLKAADA